MELLVLVVWICHEAAPSALTAARLDGVQSLIEWIVITKAYHLLFRAVQFPSKKIC